MEAMEAAGNGQILILFDFLAQGKRRQPFNQLPAQTEQDQPQKRIKYRGNHIGQLYRCEHFYLPI